MSQMNILDYLVTDFLEIHFSSKSNVIEAAKRALNIKELDGQALYLFPCFMLGSMLVVISHVEGEKIGQFVVLNPKREDHAFFTLKKAFSEEKRPKNKELNPIV